MDDTLEYLRERNQELDKFNEKLQKINHKQKLRIEFLENGLQEIRKYIENSDAPKHIKESKTFEMTIKLSYPEGF